MGIGNYPQKKTVDWGVDTKSMEFIKCKELIEKGKEESEVIELLGFFITPDSGYGRGAVLITKDALVNIPTRYVVDLENMYTDESVIKQIKSGHAAFKVNTFYSTKFKRNGYAIEFIDK